MDEKQAEKEGKNKTLRVKDSGPSGEKEPADTPEGDEKGSNKGEKKNPKKKMGIKNILEEDIFTSEAEADLSNIVKKKVNKLLTDDEADDIERELAPLFQEEDSSPWERLSVNLETVKDAMINGEDVSLDDFKGEILQNAKRSLLQSEISSHLADLIEEEKSAPNEKKKAIQNEILKMKSNLEKLENNEDLDPSVETKFDINQQMAALKKTLSSNESQEDKISNLTELLEKVEQKRINAQESLDSKDVVNDLVKLDEESISEIGPGKKNETPWDRLDKNIDNAKDAIISGKGNGKKIIAEEMLEDAKNSLLAGAIGAEILKLAKQEDDSEEKHEIRAKIIELEDVLENISSGIEVAPEILSKFKIDDAVADVNKILNSGTANESKLIALSEYLEESATVRRKASEVLEDITPIEDGQKNGSFEIRSESDEPSKELESTSWENAGMRVDSIQKKLLKDPKYSLAPEEKEALLKEVTTSITLGKIGAELAKLAKKEDSATGEERVAIQQQIQTLSDLAAQISAGGEISAETKKAFPIGNIMDEIEHKIRSGENLKTTMTAIKDQLKNHDEKRIEAAMLLNLEGLKTQKEQEDDNSPQKGKTLAARREFRSTAANIAIQLAVSLGYNKKEYLTDLAVCTVLYLLKNEVQKIDGAEVPQLATRVIESENFFGSATEDARQIAKILEKYFKDPGTDKLNKKISPQIFRRISKPAFRDPKNFDEWNLTKWNQTVEKNYFSDTTNNYTKLANDAIVIIKEILVN